MPTGYLVTLGDGSLDPGDSISASQSTFTTSQAIGNGQWTWSGVWDGDGQSYSNITDTGTYYEATDGNVYFVPDNWFTTSGSATATSTPAYGSDGVVSGTSGDDTIGTGYSDGDGDSIDGADGGGVPGDGDTISAGAGNDQVSGVNDDDLIYGGSGGDTLEGNAGDDTIYGDSDPNAPGSDPVTINASNYSDTTSGYTVSAKNISGGSQTGASSGNVHNGGSYIGASGNVSSTDSGMDSQIAYDMASGLSEELIVDFDDPIDELSFTTYSLQTANYGEVGHYALYNNGVLVYETDFTDNTGTGDVTINVSGHGDFDQIVFTAKMQTDGTNGSDYGISGITFTPTPPASTTENDSISGGDGDDIVFGETGDDTIHGDAGNDSLEGGDGNDSLDGGTGNDTIITGSGDNTVVAGAGDDQIDDVVGSNYTGSNTIDAGAGNDTVWSGGGNDSVQGGDGNDQIFGEGGNDTLFGGEGANRVDGGAGNDVLVSDGSNDTLIGGDGHDIIDQRLNSGGFQVDTFSGIEEVYASDGGDTWNWASDSVELHGGSGADTVNAGSGNDTIDGAAGNDSISAGAGNDIVTGGAGDDTFVAGAGDDTITDFNAGNSGTINDGDSTNNDFIDLSGYYDNLSELYADQADDGILNQSNTTDSDGRAVDYSDNTQFGSGSLTFAGASADNSSFTSENTGVVCFAAGTLIATTKGQVPIEFVKPGDLVLTMDNGPQPVLMSAARMLSSDELARSPNLKPVEIKGGLQGQFRPLTVSPQHALWMPVEGEQKLLRAKHLADIAAPGVRIKKGCKRVTYLHLVFEDHQIIFANGAAAESFFPGPMALRALAPDVLRELAQLFPNLVASQPSNPLWPSARRVLKARNVRDFAPDIAAGMRH